MTSHPKFTTGSTMRHVSVMTLTGAVGLLSIFLVDAANLFYISLLGATELAAAIGFAGSIQFFMISVSIGLSIAATATVSRTIGRGDRAAARRLAGSALVILVAILTAVAVVVWVLRAEALALLGATGETRRIAAQFLAIVLPSLPLMGIGMVAGGLLRAVGDARRAMYVTLSGGLVAAVLDPIFIFALGLGVDGAAIASVIVRMIFAGVGLWGVVRVHDLVGRPGWAGVAADAPELMKVALPAVATQLSTPFGNAFLTGIVAAHGDEAVAGWAVVGRLSALAFGGVFALSGAIGPIFGQNLGAGLFARIRQTYRDALVFAGVYVLGMWALLRLATGPIIVAFGLTGAGAEVLSAFTGFGAGAFLFTAALFVSNASFNNLGRPLWSTVCNWSRDAAAIPLLAALAGSAFGAASVVAIQASAALIVGSAAALIAWRYVDGMEAGAVIVADEPEAVAPTQPAFVSGRAAFVPALPADDDSEPLASRRKTD